MGTKRVERKAVEVCDEGESHRVHKSWDSTIKGVGKRLRRKDADAEIHANVEAPTAANGNRALTSNADRLSPLDRCLGQ